MTLHHSCQAAAPRAALKQLEKLCQQTLPNLPTGLISPLLHADASSHLLLTDAGGRVKAALTFRLVTLHHMGTHAPSNASIEQLLCDVVLLAVAPDAQCRGHGSRLLGLARQQLRDAAARVGSPAHTLLVQADDTAAAFWRKQGFRASAAARELVSELCAWRAAENPKFWGATPMVATMGGKAPRAGGRPNGDDDDAPLHLPYSTCKHNYVKDSEDEGEDTEIVSTHTRTYAEDIEEERDRKEREGARPGGRPLENWSVLGRL